MRRVAFLQVLHPHTWISVLKPLCLVHKPVNSYDQFLGLGVHTPVVNQPSKDGPGEKPRKLKDSGVDWKKEPNLMGMSLCSYGFNSPSIPYLELLDQNESQSMAYGALSMTRAKAPFAQRKILLKGKNQIISVLQIAFFPDSSSFPPTHTSKMIQITFNILCLSTCHSSNYPITLSEALQA